ncbi:MAG: hypothetical protein HYU75_22070 [Betaproteobacteria bacterium]|nr:hypothetical protein [Betaproteobacteria bacterium]
MSADLVMVSPNHRPADIIVNCAGNARQPAAQEQCVRLQDKTPMALGPCGMPVPGAAQDTLRALTESGIPDQNLA